MADDEQPNQFQPPPTQTVDGGIVSTVLASLAGLASALAVRAREIVETADELGNITIPVVDSTAVAELRYDLITSTMGVTFTDGSEYDVPSVSLLQFVEFETAPSKGGHWNRVFKGQSVTQFAGSKKRRIKIGR